MCAAAPSVHGGGAVEGVRARPPVRSGHDPFDAGLARGGQAPPHPAALHDRHRRIGRRPSRSSSPAAAARTSRSSASIPRPRARPTGASRAPTPSSRPCCPKAYDGKAPTRVDSGRNCTPEALGTLADAGITGVEFAGATWELTGTTGLTAAVFQGKGLSPKDLFTFYRDSGGTDRHTEKMSTQRHHGRGQERPPAGHPRERRHRPDRRGLARRVSRTRCSCCSPPTSATRPCSTRWASSPGPEC